jgi:Protein of unknown function VcgC/VcgE (DUF2780)
MNRRIVFLLVLLAISPVTSAQSVASAQTLDSLKSFKEPLVSLLHSQLGVTENQARGGIGSMLALAQEKLAKDDFEQVVSLVPGATYLDTARRLGAVTGPVTSMAGLNDALSRMGLNPETAAKFVPAVTDYLGQTGGEATQNLLAKVFR